MQRLLRNACHATNLACEQGVPLKPGLIVLIERRYDSRGPPAPAANLRVFDRGIEMTEQEEQDLHRKVERLDTEVHLLGGIAGIMLSLIGQLGWRHVEQAIIHGLTDAAASVPPRNEADWDRFMAYIRQQGAAVKVTKTRPSSIPLQPIRPASPP